MQRTAEQIAAGRKEDNRNRVRHATRLIKETDNGYDFQVWVPQSLLKHAPAGRQTHIVAHIERPADDLAWRQAVGQYVHNYDTELRVSPIPSLERAITKRLVNSETLETVAAWRRTFHADGTTSDEIIVS